MSSAVVNQGRAKHWPTRDRFVARTLLSTSWVLRSYVARGRFWWFGGLYLFLAALHLQAIAASRLPSSETGPSGLLPFFASLVAALAALHLRRLLSGPTAQTVPGYALPHFLGGAIVSLWIWLVTPICFAWLGGFSVLHQVGWHALAGITFALVLMSPRLISLMALWPILGVWVTDDTRLGAKTLIHWSMGTAPEVSQIVIIAAVVLYPLGAATFWRLRDRNAMLGDDLALEPIPAVPGAWRSVLLELRDGAMERELQADRRFAPTVYRWRMPCLMSWTQAALVLLGVSTLILLVCLVTGEATAGWLVGVVAAVVVIVTPFASWRFRARALEMEFLRPVSRDAFTSRFWTAMLYDFVGWTTFALVISLLGCVPFALWEEAPVAQLFLTRVPAFLVSLAIFLYGAGLVTLRTRYWLPWFMGTVFGYVALVGFGLAVYLAQHPARRENGDFSLYVFGAAFVGMGLLLGWFAYRRWPAAIRRWTPEIR